MENRYLIAPGDTELSKQLAEKLASRGSRVAIAESEGNKLDSVGADESNSAITRLSWDYKSILAARNFVLKGLDTLGDIDETILIYSSNQDEEPLHLLPPLKIEKFIDAQVKSYFFLLKELLSYFLRAQRGSITLVLFTPGTYTKFPLDAAAAAGFRATVDSLFELYQNERFRINAFECLKEQSSSFADFIIDTTLQKTKVTTGKWFRFGGGLARNR